MKKIIPIVTILIVILLQINLLILRTSYGNTEIEQEQKAENKEDIYDVILFWGQSNMLGYSSDTAEERFDPNDETSVKAFSEATGIDEEILKKVEDRNTVKIDTKVGTAYEYLYTTNTLEDINTKIENNSNFGEALYFNNDILNKYTSNINKNLISITQSRGTNMIPQFCKTYYENTGHKVIAVPASLGGKAINWFLPYNDPRNTDTYNARTYDAIKTKYQAAIKYLNDNNYTIGNKLYVVFQGETDVTINNKTTADYVEQFKDVHNNIKNDLGIQLGAICETSRTIGTNTMTNVNKIHEAQEQLINENDDIILGSSYSYDHYVPKESDYDNCTTKITFDEKGNKLSYNEAFTKASYSVDYSDTNTIHFTSATLSQIGKEAAESLSKIENIEISSLPTKTEYIQNHDTLDLSNAKLKIDYKNINDEIINITNNMVSGFDNTKLGTQTITITYKNLTTNFEVTVKEKQPISISLKNTPTKTQYIQNSEQIDITGSQLQITYNDNSQEIINITKEMISGFDNTKLGTQTITITYKNLTTNFEVTVKEKQPISISLKNTPTKTQYIQNSEQIDITGGQLQITYNDNSQEIINITKEMISGFDNSKLGTQTITITYKNLKTTYNIEIINNSNNSITTNDNNKINSSNDKIKNPITGTTKYTILKIITIIISIIIIILSTHLLSKNTKNQK